MNWRKILNESRLRPASDRNTEDPRNAFESDYGRIVYSPAIRRMHDKTQVVPLTKDDNVHTRLTHSLEVQSLANSMGIRLCLDTEFLKRIGLNQAEALRIIPPILSSISLCHDIGNPPFGHYGEESICNYFKEFFSKYEREDNFKDTNNCKLVNKTRELDLSPEQRMDFTKFDGNAQGFRILTKQQVMQDVYGLNLTTGVLSAYLKYPFLSEELIGEHKGKKVGIFQSEKKHLENIRKEVGLDKIRHPLTYLMEAADNICYNVMDLEDGFNSGYFSFDKLFNELKRSKSEYVRRIMDDFEEKKLKEIQAKDINLERTKMVQFRIFLIGILIDETLKRFFRNLNMIEAGRFEGELIYAKNNPLMDELKRLNWDLVINSREVMALELAGESVIKGLLNHFVPAFINYNDDSANCKKRGDKLFSQINKSAKILLEMETGKSKLADLNDYEKLRLIVDYISGMTDNFALSLYQKLQGIKII